MPFKMSVFVHFNMCHFYKNEPQAFPAYASLCFSRNLLYYFWNDHDLYEWNMAMMALDFFRIARGAEWRFGTETNWDAVIETPTRQD